MVKTSNETKMVHTRYIGEDFVKLTRYQAQYRGEVNEEIDSNLENDDAIENFKDEWNGILPQISPVSPLYSLHAWDIFFHFFDWIKLQMLNKFS